MRTKRLRIFINGNYFKGSGSENNMLKQALNIHIGTLRLIQVSPRIVLINW